MVNKANEIIAILLAEYLPGKVFLTLKEWDHNRLTIFLLH